MGTFLNRYGTREDTTSDISAIIKQKPAKDHKPDEKNKFTSKCGLDLKPSEFDLEDEYDKISPGRVLNLVDLMKFI